MSNRRRIARAPRSYGGRIERRSARPIRRRRLRPVGGRRIAGWSLVALAVAAEAGHLTTAWVEWPQSPVRGVYHVLAGALLGLLAATVSSGSVRILLVAAATAAAGPVLWLAGTLGGASPYHDLPSAAAVAITVVELDLAILLLATARRSREPVTTGPAW